ERFFLYFYAIRAYCSDEISKSTASGGPAASKPSGNEQTGRSQAKQHQARRLGDGRARHRKGGVERRKRVATDDVLADPEPVRIQLGRSVKPGGKDVPGGTIGRGADSQKKSPLVNCTWGTKK